MKRPVANRDFETAISHHRAGKLKEAEAAYRRVLAKDPNFVPALCNLAVLLKNQGKHPDAVALYQRALKRDPTSHQTMNNLANALIEMGRAAEALVYSEQAVKMAPEVGAFRVTLSWIYNGLNRFIEAAEQAREAWRLDPSYIMGLSNYASALHRMGDVEKAIEVYHEVVKRRPDFVTGHSNLIFDMHFSPRYSMQDLYDEADRWDALKSRPLTPPRESWPTLKPLDGRKPRVGFVSADMRMHPVTYFFVKAIEAREPDAFDIVIYSETARTDMMTDRIRAQAALWRDVNGLSDEDLAALIRQDEIDILIDLTGHTADHRLLAFARRPAPIQATWIGFFGTTGMDAMDFLIADPVCVPPEHDRYFKEQVIRLPDGFLCYEYPDWAPEVAPLPAHRKGYVSFGSANQLTKMTDQVVALWARVINSVPNARLSLKTKALADPLTRTRTLERFAAAGLPAERIDLLPPGVQRDILNYYGEIDVALDPFPCAGGTTTCEAMYMGVPVVTLLGERFCSRHSASHLRNAGFPEFVVNSQDAYVDLCVALAQDLGRLDEVRRRLRPQMIASPLCDAPRFARNLATAFREMCARGPRPRQ